MIAFDPGHINRVVLVGVGGTGSHLARNLARMCYDLIARGLQSPQLVFIDPDRVEQKNVGRQMFIAAELGLHKSEVLAKRFNRALGLDIAYSTEHFDAAYHCSRSDLLIGCVDNHQARRELARYKGTWLDCGNDRYSGQVIIGTSESWDMLQYLDTSDSTRWLPNAAAVYPDLLEPPPASDAPDLSCAEATLIGDQHLLVNDLMATIAAGYVFKALYRQPIYHWMSLIDIGALSVRSVLITPDELQSRAPADVLATPC